MAFLAQRDISGQVGMIYASWGRTDVYIVVSRLPRLGEEGSHDER